MKNRNRSSHISNEYEGLSRREALRRAAGAGALLGCTYQWTGSEKSIATDMVNAMNTAVSANADGIAVCLVDQTAFNDPVEKALKAGIPVVSYNADATGNK